MIIKVNEVLIAMAKLSACRKSTKNGDPLIRTKSVFYITKFTIYLSKLLSSLCSATTIVIENPMYHQFKMYRIAYIYIMQKIIL